MSGAKKKSLNLSSSQDDQFNAFLKASMGSDSDTSLSKYLKPKSSKPEKPWWQSSVETSEDYDESNKATGPGLGLGTLTGTALLKKKPPLIPPISTLRSTDTETTEAVERGNFAASVTFADSETETTEGAGASGPLSMIPPVNSVRPPPLRASRPRLSEEFRESQLSFEQSTETAGQDTMDETRADKSRFFKELGDQADGTIDYSMLNRQLDDTRIAPPPQQSSSDTPDAIRSLPFKQPEYRTNDDRVIDDDSLAQKTTEDQPPAPTVTHQTPASPVNELDTDSRQQVLEDDDDDEEVLRPPRQNLLANVSLNDTLETSYVATSGPTAEAGLGNTSQLDLDAVKEAYKQVHDNPPEATAEYHPFDEPQGNSGGPPTQRTEDSQGTSVWDLQPAPQADKPSSDGESPDHLASDQHEFDSAPPPSEPGTERSSTPIHNKPRAPSPFDFTSQPNAYQSIHDLGPVSPSPELQPIRYVVHSGSDLSDNEVLPEPPASPSKKKKARKRSPQQKSPTRRESRGSVARSAQPSTQARRSLQTGTQRVESPMRLSQGQTQSLSSRKFTHVKSSGYGVVQPKDGSKVRRSDPSPSKPKSKSAITPKRKPDGKSNRKARIEPSEDLSLDSQTSPVKLIQSVESFATYLRGQFTTSSPPSQALDGAIPATHYITQNEREAALLQEVKDWQHKWREECRMKEKVSADFLSAERDWKRQSELSRLNHQQEVHSLKQQVYILEAKIAAEKEHEAAQTDPTNANQPANVQRLEADLREQEKLISGYQTENERLYRDIKQSESLNKALHDKLYSDNQGLTTELNVIRQQLERREMELRSRGAITSSEAQQQIAAGSPPQHKTYSALSPSREPTQYGVLNTGSFAIQGEHGAALGAARISELKQELLQVKNELLVCAARVTALTANNQDVEAKLDYVTQERDKLKHVVMVSKQPAEVKVLTERYQQEIGVLEKRVRWYIENQKLLDSDLSTIKQKDLTIKNLEATIKSLEDKSSKNYDGKQRQKDRAADAKRIKDLERQVREMETILRKRNPNSISTLMWAASMVPDEQTGNLPPTMRYLEQRVDKLEAELSGKDEDTSRLLRAMEQQCDQAKMRYEERIETLESDLARLRAGTTPTNPHHSTVSALERDIRAAHDQHRKQLADKDEQIERLNQEISRFNRKEHAEKTVERRSLRQSREKFETETGSLHAKLEAKLKEVAELHDVVDRLQKEKRQLLVELNHVQSQLPDSTPSQDKKINSKTVKLDSRKAPSPRKPPVVRFDSRGIEESREEYAPERFDSEHITDVLQLNRSLTAQLEESEVRLSELKVQCQRDLARVEAESRAEQDMLLSKIKKLSEEHDREKRSLREDNSKKNSEHEVVKYKSQVEALERIIDHLKEDRVRWQHDTEELSALRIRNITLDNRVLALEDQLEDARETQSPEMRHYNRLQDKIVAMERRFSDRENELRKVISQNEMSHRADLSEEVKRWKRIVADKNHEIETFRRELDDILTVMKELKRQGVVLPL